MINYVNIFKGNKNSIINNTFNNKFIAGNYVDITYFDDDETKNQHEIIGNNFEPMQVIQKMSMIRLGLCGNHLDTANVNAGILVEDNTFNGYNNEYYEGSGLINYYEIISNKSSGNIFKNNTFKGCRGVLMIRCGDDCTIRGNRFLRDVSIINELGGVSISGSGHKIYNNYFEGLDKFPILLNGGNNIPSNENFHYKRVDGVDIAFNTIVNCENNIYINKNDDQVSIPINLKIENNLFHFTAANTKKYFDIDRDYDGIADNVTDWNTNIIDYNIFYSGTVTRSLIQTDYDGPVDPIFNNTNDIVDPLLDNSTGEYIPSVTSQVVDNANSTGYLYVVDDINQLSRKSQKDIGCHEVSNLILIPTSSNAMQFGVFPNPTVNFLNLKLDASIQKEEVSLEIQNINGALFYEDKSFDSKSIRIDVSKLPIGFYILTARTNNYRKSFKFIKQ